MQINYQKTIDTLKEAGLIQPDDLYAVCLFYTESESNGVTTTYITAKTDYIMVANQTEIKLLDIDKKTGAYLDNFLSFKKEDLVFERKNKNWVYASRGIFGGKYIGIRADYIGKFCHSYLLPKKVHGYDQKEDSVKLYNFIKEVYNEHQKLQKKLYKENK